MGAHFKGAFDAGCYFGIWYPAVGDVGSPIAAGSNFDRLTFEACWCCAWHTSMFEDEIAQPTFRVGGCLTAFLFVRDVNEKFDDASILTFWDRVGERMDDDVAIAEERFVIDGVIKVTGEAGIIPKQDAVRTVFDAAGNIYEVVEFIACRCGPA